MLFTICSLVGVKENLSFPKIIHLEILHVSTIITNKVSIGFISETLFI